MSLDFEKKMEKHFEDDQKNFGDLDKKVDALSIKTEKVTEQMVINGEHFSHFSKNIIELQKLIQEQTEVNRSQNQKIENHILKSDAHMERVEPMLTSYESDKKFNQALNDKVLKWGKRVTWLAALIAAVIYLRSVIIKLLIS